MTRPHEDKRHQITSGLIALIKPHHDNRQEHINTDNLTRPAGGSQEGPKESTPLLRARVTIDKTITTLIGPAPSARAPTQDLGRAWVPEEQIDPDRASPGPYHNGVRRVIGRRHGRTRTKTGQHEGRRAKGPRAEITHQTNNSKTKGRPPTEGRTRGTQIWLRRPNPGAREAGAG